MDKMEYLTKLLYALQGLPQEEQDNALQYYVDYFADAGAENEQKVIQELGTPEQVAQEILKDIHEITPIQTLQKKRSAKGVSPKVLIVLFLLLLLFRKFWGIPIALVGLLAVCILAIPCLIVGIPLGMFALSAMLVLGGGYYAAFSIGVLLSATADAIFGCGMSLLMIGGGLLLLLADIALVIKLGPPIIRGLVKLCRKPLEKRGTV